LVPLAVVLVRDEVIPALGSADVPVVTTAPTPVVLVLELDLLLGTDPVAVTPLLIAPGPLTTPAVAAPPPAPPLFDGPDGPEPPFGLVLVRTVPPAA
jgi:hypothetical protein